MRIRIAVMLSFLVVIAMSIPATAAPDKSPVFEEIPFQFAEVWFNPCLGYDEMFYGDGSLFVNEMTNPSGNYHFNAIGYVALRTDSGFQSPYQMAGIGQFHDTGNVYKYTEVDHYSSMTNGEQTFRFQWKAHLTIVDDEAKVDTLTIDMTCRPQK